MIHYHGTPITPAAVRDTLAGRNFCISHADPRDLAWALQAAQSVMGDTGEFSNHTRGRATDHAAYYRWAEPWLRHPHWAIVPDRIGGTEAENLALAAAWPFRRDVGAVVWHLHESMDHLARLADDWPRLAFGSSGQYWRPGTDAWTARIEAAWNLLERTGRRPAVHMLRAMQEASTGPWPFASADSTNLARNHATSTTPPLRMALNIEARNPAPRYQPAPIQQVMI